MKCEQAAHPILALHTSAFGSSVAAAEPPLGWLPPCVERSLQAVVCLGWREWL
jgi:hypothetical protein